MNAEHRLKETSALAALQQRVPAAAAVRHHGSLAQDRARVLCETDGRSCALAIHSEHLYVSERSIQAEARTRAELASPPMREGRPSKALRPPRATRPLWLTDPSREDEAAREVREERMLDLS